MTSLVHRSAANTIAITAYHTNHTADRFGPWQPGATVPRVALGLQVGGSTVVSTSGPGWESFNAQRVHNPAGNAGDIWYHQPQENLDLGAIPTGWQTATVPATGSTGGASGAGSAGGNGWGPAQQQPGFTAKLELKPTRPIRVQTVSTSVIKRGPGHYVVDVGKEIQGGLILAMAGRAGDRVSIGYGEELTDDFANPAQPNSTLPACPACTVRCCPMRTTNVFWSTWTLRDGHQTGAQHEYMQFRFAEIVGPTSGFVLTNASAWVVRYDFGPRPGPAAAFSGGAAPPGPVGLPGSGITTFASSSPGLDRVFELCQYTVVSGTLDVSTDSNTRQRSTCHIDMRVATLVMLYGLDGGAEMPTHNAALMLQNNSNIYDGWADFKAATVFTVHQALLHGGGLGVARKWYGRLELFSLANFIDPALGLLRKPSLNVPGPAGCLNGTSPCAGDLVDWPPAARDGYVLAGNNVSTVPNGYAQQALDLLADIAGWLGKVDDQARFARAAAGIRAAMGEHLYDAVTGRFADGIDIDHAAVHASIVAAATGVVRDPAVAEKVLAALEATGIFEGEVLTTCWIAGTTVEALYALDAVAMSGKGAELGQR